MMSAARADRVDEVVVAGCRDGDRHQERVGDEEGAQEAARGGAVADDCEQDAPADMHARHGGVWVDANPGERAGIVAGHPDGVGDAESRDKPRRGGGVEDVEEDGDAEGGEEEAAEVAVVRSVADREPADHRHEQWGEAEHVVDGEKAHGRADELLQRGFMEEVERAFEIDQPGCVGECLVGVADGEAADGEVGRVDRGPEQQLGQREPRSGANHNGRPEAWALRELRERVADHEASLPLAPAPDIRAQP